MPYSEVQSSLVASGFEVHGRARGRSCACHVIASKRGSWDFGRKDCRTFVAVKLNDVDADWVSFKFSMSGTALACKWVKELTGDPEEFLRDAGLLRFRQLLQEDDTPGRSEEYMLHSRSPRDEFCVSDSAVLRAEVSRVRKELLELLWENRHRGKKRTQKGDIEDKVCTLQSIIDSVLNSFEQRKLINGAFGSSGIKITVEGEVELEKLQGNLAEPSWVTNQPNEGVLEQYDLFISHASEDKNTFVRPFAHALRESGLKVWYDEFSLSMGDSLRESIDRGLAASKHGVVVLSHDFFAKPWPQRELNGLFATMKAGERRILPVWHELSAEEVQKYSPMVADILAANSAEGIDAVVKKVVEACQR